ncbi:hypothetical protein KEU06_08955 [Pseudaminobacter sp. 19-2017]|uniref:Uncharacterized protein n=1 Tax=Pseudaminobacter soli (ex Zhang et al. 2022) TaxID=2831468 RepID=A0A942I8Z3_9HYPH|nr:hypothetical protein [Pseudaminobacter soli]MBS3648756.1 hypothetical protein [Pseudaminobacter soli]
MAQPVAFAGQTDILGAPKGSAGVKPLPCYMDGSQVISAWQLSPEEIEEVLRTGIVWCFVMSSNQPPVYLTGTNPFPKTQN